MTKIKIQISFENFDFFLMEVCNALIGSIITHLALIELTPVELVVRM